MQLIFKAPFLINLLYTAVNRQQLTLQYKRHQTTLPNIDLKIRRLNFIDYETLLYSTYVHTKLAGLLLS